MSASLSSIRIDDQVIKSFNDQTRSKSHRFILYKLSKDYSEISVDLASSAEASHEEFLSALPDNECRFATLRVNYDEGVDGQREKCLMIMWSPMNSTVKNRMLYATTKNPLKLALSTNSPISIETGNKNSLTMEEIVARCRKGGQN